MTINERPDYLADDPDVPTLDRIEPATLAETLAETDIAISGTDE